MAITLRRAAASDCASLCLAQRSAISSSAARSWI